MSNFDIDYNGLSSSVKYIDKEIFKLSDVKHRIERFAFDIVKFKDGTSDELWQVQNSDDGDYIVAKYEIDEPKEASKEEVKWDVVVNAAKEINIFYNNYPVVKVASDQLGVLDEDLDTVKNFLPNKLASDKNFAKSLINTLDETSKSSLLKLYPELL